MKCAYVQPVPTQDNYDEIIAWAMGLALTVSTASVAAFQLLIALAMRFGDGIVFDMADIVVRKTTTGSPGRLGDTTLTE